MLIAAGLAFSVIGLVFGTLIALHYAAIVFGAAKGASRTVVQWMAVVSILTASFALFLSIRAKPVGPQVDMEPSGGRRRGPALDGRNGRLTQLLQPILSYHEIYGRVASAAMLLLWLYLTSAAVLIGAELNSEMEKAREAIGVEGRLRRNPAGRLQPNLDRRAR